MTRTRTYILRPRSSVVLRTVPDSKHAEDSSCQDAAWKPLTRLQKCRLVILARAAYRHQGISDIPEPDWRRRISVRACGRRISEATQGDWANLKSAFEDLAGQPDRAFRTQLRDGDNKRRVALHKLTAALAAKGLHVSYAAAICRAQFKCSLEDASAKQLWCLFYTVSNRRRK